MKRKQMDTVWLVWAKWSDGTWGVWPYVGCARTRRELNQRAMRFFRENEYLWAMHPIEDRHSRRIKYVKHEFERKVAP
jgi:hypothetical protein